MPILSLIIPIFNEEAVIPELHRRLEIFLKEVNETWEVLFVNDGSKDRSLTLLREIAHQDKRYKIISFSRNFGHQFAITAGLDRASGEAVIVMDADLQDPPEVVREMIARWREGYDIVYGIRKSRQGETLFKRLSASLYYRVLRKMVGIAIPKDAGDFRLMSRPVVLTLRSLRESNRFIRGMVAWLGFRQSAVYFERSARFAGETKFPLRKMIRFAIDGITSFSTIPLRLATWLGAFSGLVAIVTALWSIYIKLFTGTAIPGWTTIMIAVSLGSSAQLLMTGILGEYIGRIFDEVKRRPLYVVSEEHNFTPPEPSDKS